MGGELVAVVAIAGCISDDALARPPHPIERRADGGDGGLAAADKDIEVERDRADARVGRGCIERVDQLGDSIFAGGWAAAQSGERILPGRLLRRSRAQIEAATPLARAVLIGLAEASRRACRRRPS